MTKTGEFFSGVFLKRYNRRADWFSIIAAVSLIWASPVTAEKIRVTASADKQKITLEDSLTLSITIEGGSKAPPPKLPPIPEFDIRSQGSSSSVQIINGLRSASMTYNFLLVPITTGSFTIGPATVMIDGSAHRTRPIRIVVSKPSQKLDASRDTFAELIVSNSEPYVQEQVTATLRIYYRTELRNLGANIKFPGFREEKLKGPIRRIRVVDGREYQVLELSSALFPLQPGSLKIPAGIIEFDQLDRSRRSPHPDRFDPFGKGSLFERFANAKHRILRTQPVDMQIQPLPDKNRPKDFSNLVGSFTI